MKDHFCPDSGCLYCMVVNLYAKIDDLNIDNLRMARELLQEKRLTNELRKMSRKENKFMDKAIKKEKKTIDKGMDKLVKMDVKHDKKMEKKKKK